MLIVIGVHQVELTKMNAFHTRTLLFVQTEESILVHVFLLDLVMVVLNVVEEIVFGVQTKKTCASVTNPGPCLQAHTCPCDTNKDCGTCQEDDGCAWCTMDAKCIASTGGACSGPLAHTCPQTICQDHLDCDTCHNKDGCKWCSNLGACKPNNAAYGDCAIPLSCSSYCEKFKDCDVCNVKSGCGWCTHTSTCVNLAQTECAINHLCPAPSTPSKSSKKKGFDAGSFVGGMFLVIGLVGIGVIGFFVYKWKFSQRASYQELTVNKS